LKETPVRLQAAVSSSRKLTGRRAPVSIHCSSTEPAHAYAAGAMLRNSLSTRHRSIRPSG
jgi:hypothetical protein